MSSRLPNVNFIGRLSFDKVWSHYCRASLLVCTSEYEGFPNTFLEAMACKLPIVSSFDPGNVIVDFQLGETVADAASLTECLQGLQEDASRLLIYSANASQYFDQFHRASVALPKFEKVIVEAVQ